jgi:N-formylglutamate amidohydrolase
MSGRVPRGVPGDRYGTSCVAAVAEAVGTTLRGRGYSVSRNKPYAGGFITEHYGNPAAGLHAIQLELNREFGMDERRFGARRPSSLGCRSGSAGLPCCTPDRGSCGRIAPPLNNVAE